MIRLVTLGEFPSEVLEHVSRRLHAAYGMGCEIEGEAELPDGALGDDQSSHDESFSCGLLEYPQYTRPAEFRGMKVPEVLLSGNHAEIEKWRLEQAKKRTKERRRDLLNKEQAE